MRLTCLKCGNQMEAAVGGPSGALVCTCGTEISFPEVYNTGVRPNERAAERSRYKAFRAAGVVKNMGGFALGLSLLGLLFFPFGLLGAAVGVYVLTMLRGPILRYSGRRAAVGAIAIGVTTFGVQGTIAWRYLEARGRQQLVDLQASAGEDLRALLRSQRLFHAAQERYGTFRDFRFEPRHGKYTLYLGTDDWLPAKRGDGNVVDPLPPTLAPGVGAHSFTAVAVANLDADGGLDVWVLNDRGEIRQVEDDSLLSEVEGAARVAPAPAQIALPAAAPTTVAPPEPVAVPVAVEPMPVEKPAAPAPVAKPPAEAPVPAAAPVPTVAPAPPAPDSKPPAAAPEPAPPAPPSVPTDANTTPSDAKLLDF